MGVLHQGVAANKVPYVKKILVRTKPRTRISAAKGQLAL